MAYNILGSADEAYDVIQDVVLKVNEKGLQPENEKNYLTRAVINQSLNRKRNRSRLESENELPQPLVTGEMDLSTELKDLVSYSLLVLLEKLSPKERAVFILKEAFAYTHQEIADVLSLSTANARKIYSRSQAKIQNKSRPQKRAKPHMAKQLVEFTEAIHNKDLDRLHQLLHEDIEFRADGGTAIQVVAKSLTGVSKVAELLLHVHQRFQQDYQLEFTEVNHQPAVLYTYQGEVKVCQVVEWDEDQNQIKGILNLLDPEKLKRLKG